MEYSLTFPKLHQFFQAFRFCTIHLFWMPDGNTELQQTFMQLYSKIQQPTFSVIQTTNWRYNISLEWDSWSGYAISVETQTNLEFISKLYKTVLFNLKFTTFCTLELPVLDGTKQIDVEMYFKLLNFYRDYVKLREIKYVADVIVLPIKLRRRYTQELTFKVMDSLQSVKIIILSEIESSVFVPCNPFVESCWIHEKLRWVLVEWRSTFDIKSIWSFVAKKHVKPAYSYDPSWDINNLCPFKGKR